MRFKRFLLNEATYDHEQDIDYIYEKILPFAQDFVDNFEQQKIRVINKDSSQLFLNLKD